MTRTLVKFPSRSRPRRFFETLAKWRVDPSVEFLFSLDRDDPCLDEYLTTLARQDRTSILVGDSKTKVEAINDGGAEATWDVLIVAADDMVPQRPDYGSYLAAKILSVFPDGDGVLHTNDGRNGMALNTIPIMGRKYFDRFGYVYNHEYVSLWCDNEFQDVSDSLGRSVYLDEVVIRHDWIGDHEPDALHRRNEAFYATDAATYQRRKEAGFLAIKD